MNEIKWKTTINDTTKLCWAKVITQHIKGQNFIQPNAVGQFMLENCSTNLEKTLSHHRSLKFDPYITSKP